MAKLSKKIADLIKKGLLNEAREAGCNLSKRDMMKEFKKLNCKEEDNA